MNTSEIIFGGGRFWCTQAIFQQVLGVHNIESGYS
jgi:peptide methionine sulfoxide reductase MsrA